MTYPEHPDYEEKQESIARFDEDGNDVYDEEKAWVEAFHKKKATKKRGAYRKTSPHSGAEYEVIVVCE